MAKTHYAKPPWEDPPKGLRRVRDIGLFGQNFNRVAWSPDGKRLATTGDKSPSICTWDAETGKQLRSYQGDRQYDVAWRGSGTLATAGAPCLLASEADSAEVFPNAHCVSISPDGTSLAFGFDSGQVLISKSAGHPTSWQNLAGHEYIIRALAHTADSAYLASLDTRGHVRVWDVARRTVRARTRIPESESWSLVWWEDGLSVLVGHAHGISLVEVDSGRVLVQMQHSAGIVTSMSLSSDRRLLAATGQHCDVVLYRTSDWLAVAQHTGRINSAFPGVAFHPHKPLLAAPSAHTEQLTIWEVDIDLLTRGATSNQESYATARVALLGDSGAGKSCLGYRIAEGDFKEHSSTHGQQYWTVPALATNLPDGRRCEVVLWDLAGQPDYRIVHALFLEEVDVALLLFDPTDADRPLAGPEYWLRQIRSAARRPPYFMLVGARIDRGSPTLTPEDLDRWCQANNVQGGYVGTSATRGTGVDELLGRLRGLIRWEEMTTTITSDSFEAIKRRVLALQQDLAPGDVLLSMPELSQRLGRELGQRHLHADDLLSAVRNLESHRYVMTVRDRNNELLVLMAPGVLINLASSFVLEARSHARGLGVLEEDVLFDAKYRFQELAGLQPKDSNALLEAVTQLFVRHAVCFRETLQERTLLVFPSLINERSPVAETTDFVDDVAYRVSGAVENVYPALVVLLAYTGALSLSHQWHHRARYELPSRHACGFRLINERDSAIELVLEFHRDTPVYGRDLFRGLFESFLAGRDVEVRRIPVVRCGQCQEQQERSAVSKQIDRGKGFIHCDNCGEKLELPSGSGLELSSRTQTPDVARERAGALARRDFEARLLRMKTIFADTKRPAPTCFISYAWGDPGHQRRVLELATDLRKGGVDVVFDRWHCGPGDSITEFIERIDRVHWIVAIGSPDYRRKHDDEDSDGVVRAEQKLIKTRLRKRHSISSTVIPLLFEGTKVECYPALFEDQVHIDLRDPAHHFTGVEQLLFRLLGIGSDHPGMRQDSLR